MITDYSPCGTCEHVKECSVPMARQNIKHPQCPGVKRCTCPGAENVHSNCPVHGGALVK